MYIASNRLIELGITKELLEHKLGNGEWKTCEPLHDEGNKTEPEVLLSSLPLDLQLKCIQLNSSPDYPEQIAVLLSEASEYGLNEHTDEIANLLIPLSLAERRAWIDEALRMAKIAERYSQIHPKRQRKSKTNAWEFAPGIAELCQETACKDLIILTKQPHRKDPLSPHTLDGLYREYGRRGLLTFLPKIKKRPPPKQDKRRAVISDEAVLWINRHWRQFHGPRFLYDALKKEAKNKSWKIPSESWLYRYWRDLPEIVKTFLLKGKQSYVSKHEPYVPHDYSDLQALQVLCGDHSERDVTVTLPDGTIKRPWLTIWYDLRTGLIWGWHLSLVPSSFTAGLAYADGVQNFGAQPLARPEIDFYSYVYTDHGRDYKSHNWDGREIAVHKEAMTLDGGIECILMQQRVGILEELNIKHLLAKRRNAKEKLVERVHKDITAWEQNTFVEFCGRDTKSRPDQWLILYDQYQRFKKGKCSKSPFISFEQYRDALAGFITLYNTKEHERPTLGSKTVIPIEEYKQLYTTRYEISSRTLALLLMKAEKRKIGKNGVQCFQKHWFYFHEAMSVYKGKSVEIRYSDDNYRSVKVVLPNMKMCDAHLVTPTSLINPNKETLKVIKNAKSNERRIISEFELIAHSKLRGESTEDRAARELETEIIIESDSLGREDQKQTGHIHQLTRLARSKASHTPKQVKVTSAKVAQTSIDTSIFFEAEQSIIKEFDYE